MVLGLCTAFIVFRLEAIIFLLFNICVLVAGLINLATRNSERKSSFITLSCFYGIGTILGFYTFMQSSFGTMFSQSIGVLVPLVFSITFIIFAVKQKKPTAYLTKCPLCNHDISSETKSCPNCGNKIANTR